MKTVKRKKLCLNNKMLAGHNLKRSQPFNGLKVYLMGQIHFAAKKKKLRSCTVHDPFNSRTVARATKHAINIALKLIIKKKQ